MTIQNIVLIALIIMVVLLYIYYVFKQNIDEPEKENRNKYSLDYLCKEVREIINEIINQDVDDINGIPKRERENMKEQKSLLSKAIRSCSQGYIGQKEFVCDYIKSILQHELEINNSNIDYIIPFENEDCLTAQDEFEIMMYLEKSKGNCNMFRSINDVTEFDILKVDEKGYFYNVEEQDVKKAYQAYQTKLEFDDKLNILTQRVYQESYGLSVADMLIMDDLSVDGISGGVSGTTEKQYRYMEEIMQTSSAKPAQTFESVYIFYGGKPIHLKFLSFQKSANIARVCKNLAENCNKGSITKIDGIKQTHLADGSRVVVTRSGNTTHWSFFIRKFSSVQQQSLENLITDFNYQVVIECLKWLVKGNVNLIVSGDQNSGKTTCTRVLIRYIDRRYPIRTVEEDFELDLNNCVEYGDKNIQAFRPTDAVPMDKLISFLRKTDAHTILFGETASLDQAKHLIDLLLSGTKRIITTGHWPTTDELISYFVLAMKKDGGFGSTEDAELLVSRLFQIDVHWVKDADGKRHIDRITEVIPYEIIDETLKPEEDSVKVIAECMQKMVRKRMYLTKDIIRYQDGAYIVNTNISEHLIKHIHDNIIPTDQKEFEAFITNMKYIVEKENMKETETEVTA